MNTQSMERLQNVVDNLKANSTLRPKDVLNFVNMLWHMPKADAGSDLAPLHPAQVALTMLTRMQLSYEPKDTVPWDSSSFSQLARHQIEEPTVSLFVDAPEHLSGVSLTLQSWAEQAQSRGLPFFLHMAASDSRIPGSKCFPNIGTLKLSTYPGLDLPIPKIKKVTQYMASHPFDVAHLSTPGPMGLLGMRLAQSRGIPICGTYHTDFPRYVLELSGCEDLAEFTWQYMVWFYGQMDMVAAPSSATRDDLIAHGLQPERVQVVGRGVEQDHFSPEKRSETLRKSWGVTDEPVLLYVGRISKEKNLQILSEAYRRLVADGTQARLVLVGDGPYREEMEEELADTPAQFTGVLKGEALYEAFASGDLFVFPSETDTFGRVLIEAQASGLPVLVSDQGGPRDTLLPEQTGRIVAGVTAERFAEQIRDLIADPHQLQTWSLRAREHASSFTPERSFDDFWNLHRKALASPASSREFRHAQH